MKDGWKAWRLHAAGETARQVQARSSNWADRCRTPRSPYGVRRCDPDCARVAAVG
eukprot:CAMPEP_0185173070 /NCGR_PEP_ID=MMETSP1139-20130426/22739_1 /TAXON_ID=298111 /ORGANISM="Pavlova sp., Strain CCMP459" /LENGTH=54 /DNA_ID=CAMNT_0027738745 /DNA_START=136 /DNA_END=297 /DNA_ORIENTATION=+